MFDFFAAPFGVLGDQRNLSEIEYQQRMIQQATLMLNVSQNSMYQMLAMQNYRPSVIVPAGWAEWFAIGDELQ